MRKPHEEHEEKMEVSILNGTSNVTDSVFAIFQIASIFSPLIQNLMIQVLM